MTDLEGLLESLRRPAWRVPKPPERLIRLATPRLADPGQDMGESSAVYVRPSEVRFIRPSGVPGCSAVGHGDSIDAVLGSPDDVAELLGMKG